MRLSILAGLARIGLRLLGYGLLGGSIVAIIIYVRFLESRPDLSVWHYAELDEEYTAGADISDLSQYLALEDRLFAQLDDLVYAKVPPGPGNDINRYSRASLSDPGSRPINWNRTFELRAEQPKAGVLLLHGLSDSPYSLRGLGERLHQAGAWVVGLRIPGHGTAPSGLVRTRWPDMAGAVRLAARHVAQVVGERPIYLVGYSNGGALCVEYALATLRDESLPRPSGMVLLSPAIGVSGAAALAVWQARLGRLLGLDKLAWNSVLPEYDPYKYGSFAINAGDLVYRLTLELQTRLDALGESGELRDMPPILAFQSTVDATVSPRALVEHLFARLPPANHELVLFDINREREIEALLVRDPKTEFEPLLRSVYRGFDLTVVANEQAGSSRVVAQTWVNGRQASAPPTPLAPWPPGVYSLAHVALPFSPDDPVYGGPSAPEAAGIQLGNLSLRGERGVLQVSGTDLLRLRWNPFFDYVQSRILQFMQLPGP